MVEIDIRIQLAGLWITLMCVYFLGDILRIYSGDCVPGEIGGKKVHVNMWIFAAMLMLMPISMIALSLILDYEINRWANIGVAIFFFIFTAIDLKSYPSLYDKFLLVVGMILNLIIAWMAWHWVI